MAASQGRAGLTGEDKKAATEREREMHEDNVGEQLKTKITTRASEGRKLQDERLIASVVERRAKTNEVKKKT